MSLNLFQSAYGKGLKRETNTENLLQLTDHYYMNAGLWESTDRYLLVISLFYCIIITKAEQGGNIWMTTSGKIHLQIHPSMGG